VLRGVTSALSAFSVPTTNLRFTFFVVTIHAHCIACEHACLSVGSAVIDVRRWAKYRVFALVNYAVCVFCCDTLCRCRLPWKLRTLIVVFATPRVRDRTARYSRRKTNCQRSTTIPKILSAVAVPARYLHWLSTGSIAASLSHAVAESGRILLF